jgi:hypothetical protein
VHANITGTSSNKVSDADLDTCLDAGDSDLDSGDEDTQIWEDLQLDSDVEGSDNLACDCSMWKLQVVVIRISQHCLH